MTYRIEILCSAQRQLAKVSRHDQPRLLAAMGELAHTPRPPGAKKLVGRPAWRIRVGVYRVIYEIIDDRLVIVVVVIGHRKDVYR